MLFTDLPGYGYAKISKEISADWPLFIDPYLRERTSLALCLALVDTNIPPQTSDQQLIDFLSASGRPYLIVATKSDRLSGNQLTNTLRFMRQNHPKATIVPFSAKSGSGRDELWQEIRKAVEAMAPSHI
jgi:GTP-binding protein